MMTALVLSLDDKNNIISEDHVRKGVNPLILLYLPDSLSGLEDHGGGWPDDYVHRQKLLKQFLNITAR